MRIPLKSLIPLIPIAVFAGSSPQGFAQAFWLPWELPALPPPRVECFVPPEVFYACPPDVIYAEAPPCPPFPPCPVCEALPQAQPTVVALPRARRFIPPQLGNHSSAPKVWVDEGYAVVEPLPTESTPDEVANPNKRSAVSESSDLDLGTSSQEDEIGVKDLQPEPPSTVSPPVESSRIQSSERNAQGEGQRNTESSAPNAILTDKPGIVTSPHSPNALVDVSGLESGSLAIDPTSQKIFRVP